jgi:peptidoglycan/LPS O-acetylase OafA/YrhL
MSAVPITPEAPATRAAGPSKPTLAFHHRPSLDGIRAIAALLVILFHAGMPLFGHGYVGVDVFFVLSGFLITSLLARELLGTGRLSFVAFYARRARRLLPASLGVLLVTAVAYELVAPVVAVAEHRGGFVAAALYFSNWYFLAESRDYFAEDADPSPVQHYWSLSVEEQFYLVWPVVVLGLFFLARRYRMRLDWSAGVLALAGLVYAGVLAAQDPMASYFGTPPRAYQLLIGASIALLCLRWETSGDGKPPTGALRAGPFLAVGGLALVLLSGIPWLISGSPYWHGVGSALGTGALILGLELAPRSRAAQGLAWQPAQLLGKWSYAAYLWHWPIIIIGDDLGVLPASWAPRTALVVAVTVLLSAGTFYAVERPTQRIGLRTPGRRRAVALGGLATAAVVAVGCAAVLRIDAQAQAILRQTIEEPATPIVNVRGESGGTSVVLIGDSHGERLYPTFSTLARRQGWSLAPVIKSACSWPRITTTYAGGGVREACEGFRTEAVQAGARAKADIAILVSRAIVRRQLLRGDDLLHAGDEGWLQEVAEGTEAFLSDLRAVVDTVVIVEPLVETKERVIECLAEGHDPKDCAAPAISLPGTLELESYWRSLPSVITVSLDEIICPDGMCPAMVNGIVTHQDTNHITFRFARAIAPQVDQLFRLSGINLATGEVDGSRSG